MPQPMRLARPAPTTTFWIVSAALAGSWLATVLIAPLRGFVEAHLLVTAQTLPQLELWSALTHALFPRDFLGVLLNILMLYLFGGELERAWGAKKWWGTVVAATLAGGALAIPAAWLAGSAAVISGFDAGIAALMAAYCWRIWDARISLLSLELSGKALFGGLVALDVIFALLALDPTRLVLRLTAMGVGLLAAIGPRDLRMQWTRWRARRKLRVVKGSPPPRDPRKTKDGRWVN